MDFILAKAIRDRDKFLEEHPELLGMQMDLDNSFNDFGNDPMTNMEIIRDAMKVRADKLQRMQDELTSWWLCDDTDA